MGGSESLADAVRRARRAEWATRMNHRDALLPGYCAGPHREPRLVTYGDVVTGLHKDR